ncbi:hypothetical protein Tmar_0056 [Thermaerobacter marianensis DSM 12885]|uniref:Pel9A-like right handed beta-helix region domain-containing protein n=1 Tax=Thermaerobacter marianensis (strain ATCC 700841 / DSM 12885 / JCM 10246 / 7p75a) TaxID=644966 RepID=E6SKJ4_THEM7|nr:DUF1565 domain-containing protein [Thermaerobacter marianensis]ADU50181.1 hypothetical protein Tmar_0056 [Thermaerobacter marianensis DSM 12885]
MATYYVAPYGNDTNAGTSPSAPFATINKAAQVMVDGDVCYVAPGVYREAVSVPAQASGTKLVSFIGDTEARNFPGVQPGEVRLDGSDDDVNPVRTTGVSIGSGALVRWRRINVVRFSSYGFTIGSANLNIANIVEECIVNSRDVAFYITNAAFFTIRKVNVENCARALQVPGGNNFVLTAEDMLLESVDVGFDLSTHSWSRVVLRRIYHRAAGSTRLLVFMQAGELYAEDVVVVNGALLSTAVAGSGNFRHVTIVRATAVKPGGTNCLYFSQFNNYDGSDSLNVYDSLFAESQYGVYVTSGYPRVLLHSCAFPDVTTAALNADIITGVKNTTTDSQANVILPDFTPVGAQILRAEEQNPIEGLRSARIDVPRVAYYKFQVAVSGPNTITLKAKKSHATGTTVKFRVDEDPNKVVTLADTDQVQTVQLGPVEDRGPRFVPLEVWAQQVDYIDGHYLLIDSIQVI